MSTVLRLARKYDPRAVNGLKIIVAQFYTGLILANQLTGSSAK